MRASQARETLGVFQELNYLFQFVLRLVDSGDIRKR